MSGAGFRDEDMCPNCVTPWKCNGPHLVSRVDQLLARFRAGPSSYLAKTIALIQEDAKADAALDVERLARALGRGDPEAPLGYETEAAAIAVEYARLAAEEG